MDFGGGFAVGLAAGIGSGMAIGSGSQTNSKEKIRDYIDDNGITILDRQGRPIKTDRFLEDAVADTKSCKSHGSSLTIQLVTIGVIAFAVAAAVAYVFVAWG